VRSMRWSGASLAETERALGESRPDVSFRHCGTAELCCDLSGDRCALRRASAPIVASRSRYRNPCHAGRALRRTMGTRHRSRFAVLMHDLVRLRTSPEQWPSHRRHEEAVYHWWRRFRTAASPQRIRELAVLGARHHAAVPRAAGAESRHRPQAVETTDGVSASGALRRIAARMRIGCSRPHGLGRTAPTPGLNTCGGPGTRRPRPTVDEDRVGLQGPAIGAQIRARRLEAVTRSTRV